ncbi:MAG: redoxin domain-containing protein [Chloroflexi bacterium]|nr:redoxin domain-containing protein [Chloroflexota bacterium]
MVNIGDKAPDFVLPATGNRHFHLEDFKGKKNVVLFFYPLDWTPV